MKRVRLLRRRARRHRVHGDVRLPLLEQKTGIKTVTFARYNVLRITPLADPSKGCKTLADIPKGSKIGVPSAVSSTLV